MPRSSRRTWNRSWIPALPTALVVAGVVALGGACARGSKSGAATDGQIPLTFVYQPLGGNAAELDAILDEFRARHPEIALRTQLLPNASDVAHQYFLTSLEGQSESVDVLVVDVVWVAEFARAGWIADLSDQFPVEQLRRTFLPGPAEAVSPGGKVYALPWYLDVGLLYYRTDLVPRPPRTYDELISESKAALATHPELAGYVWQGRQYEGLICNVYEAIWGHRGQSFQDDRLALESPPSQAALRYLRSLLTSGVSPPAVTSYDEEDARRAFQDGRAVFMRNWPYAWSEAQSPTSKVHGKVGFAPLPSLTGEPGPGTLGGWQLAVNARLSGKRRDAAIALIRHLTSKDASVRLALASGRNPPRRDAYDDPRLVQGAPFIRALLPLFERARPRPVTPYYGLLADGLQGEFSAAISGVRSPEDALRRAQRRADFLMRQGER